ncbi:MAG: DUF6351 family protein [Thermoproteota archaeon]
MGARKNEVVLDLDEYFEKPVPHRYLHGYFEDEPDTRFSLLLPKQDFWSGRSIQFVEGGLGGNEYIAPQDLEYYAIQKYGAVCVKSNHGHVGEDLSKIGYEKLDRVAHQANYRTMLYARETMKKEYGRYPKYTYVVGGSGGGLRSTILMEKYPEIYDGAVPFVQAELSVILHYFSLLAKLLPVLKNRLNEIMDAADASGSGDSYGFLATEEEKNALRELYDAGFPRGAEQQLASPRFYTGIKALITLFQELLALSPERAYYEDFWTKKGYAGYEGEVANSIVELKGRVVETYTFNKLMSLLPPPKVEPDAVQPLIPTLSVERRSIPTFPPEAANRTVGFKGTESFAPGELAGYTVTFKTGRLMGRSFHVSSNFNDIILVSGYAAGYAEEIAEGDEYTLDNRDLLAFAHYHRHVAALIEEPYGPRRLLQGGEPQYPQRPVEARRILKMKHFQTGSFNGKMILVFAAHDAIVWPTVLFNYLELVRKRRGVDTDRFLRCYLVENASHGPPANREESFSIVSFYPIIGRALEYIIRWVENSEAPPPSTVAELAPDYSLSMPRSASERMGLQPVVAGITVNGKSGSVKASLEKPVEFEGVAEAPVGNIIRCEWYCRDLEDFYHEDGSIEPGPRVRSSYLYTFRRPGTYTIVFRATSDLGDNHILPSGGQRNLARVRIIVEK